MPTVIAAEAVTLVLAVAIAIAVAVAASVSVSVSAATTTASASTPPPPLRDASPSFNASSLGPATPFSFLDTYVSASSIDTSGDCAPARCNPTNAVDDPAASRSRWRSAAELANSSTPCTAQWLHLELSTSLDAALPHSLAITYGDLSFTFDRSPSSCPFLFAVDAANVTLLRPLELGKDFACTPALSVLDSAAVTVRRDNVSFDPLQWRTGGVRAIRILWTNIYPAGVLAPTCQLDVQDVSVRGWPNVAAAAAATAPGTDDGDGDGDASDSVAGGSHPAAWLWALAALAAALLAFVVAVLVLRRRNRERRKRRLIEQRLLLTKQTPFTLTQDGWARLQ
ncbi:hypothetical protein DFJ73DRAFT_914346 [Zopfochytrium polystomum]|nr:hypothetical protein DFJ73DRAFT_914346 [Zopfochytrium polystomum]